MSSLSLPDEAPRLLGPLVKVAFGIYGATITARPMPLTPRILASENWLLFLASSGAANKGSTAAFTARSLRLGEMPGNPILFLQG